jgi:membrane fusion protein (multidrug efflux system)
MIPAKSTLPRLEGEQVFIAKNGKAKAIDIKTGYRTEREIEIIKGLSANDTLITTGLLQIKEGMPVKVKVQNR